MAGSLRLVVARYEEDLGWLNRVDKRWRRSVVTKGQQLPNTGREASSFLWAMEHLCREDDGWVCFVQGDPFKHYPALLDVLNKAAAYPLQFVPLGTEFLTSDEAGGPHDADLPVREWFEAMIGDWPEGNRLQFAPGGQFLIPAAYLRGRTLDEIRAARAMCDAIPEGAYTMERLWWPWLVW